MIFTNQTHKPSKQTNFQQPINLYFLWKQTQHKPKKFSFLPHHHQEYPSKICTQSPTTNIGYTISADEINGGGVGGDDDLLIKQVVSLDGDDDLPFHAKHHFSSFKARFGKSYGSIEEHDYRFGVFKANLHRAKLHQKLDPSVEHGVTKFSDLTLTEFWQKFLGLKRLRLPSDAQKAPILPTNDLPTDFNWRDHSTITGVKD